MKKHWVDILLILVFLIGLSVLLYPAVSNYINEKHQSRFIQVYEDKVNDTSAEELEKAWADAYKYNEQITNDPMTLFKPELATGYKEALNVTGDGMMGYIYIPKLNSILSIYHGTSDLTLQTAVGHMEGSSLPMGGLGTHTVLMGHRGLPSAKLFSDLDKLEVGDRFSLNVLDKVLNYEVDQILITEPGDVKNLHRKFGQDYCTLVTCTPYGVNTHRLLVRGHRVADDSAEEVQIIAPSDAIKLSPLLMAPIVAIPLVILLLIYLVAHSKKKKEENTSEKAD